MRRDLWRIFSVLALGLAIGAVLDRILLTLFLATLLLLGWYIRRMQGLLAWLRSRKTAAAPDSPGMFEEICSEIDRMRERQKRRKKTLATYLKRFREATTALPDAVVVLGPDGEIEWANDAAADLLNVRWPQDRRQRITNIVRRAEIDEIVERGTDGGTAEITAPDDEARRLSVSIVPYVKKQRLFVARDTTKLHRLNQIRSDFVANVSHELKTPLTVFSGYVETLAEGQGELPAEMANGYRAFAYPRTAHAGDHQRFAHALQTRTGGTCSSAKGCRGSRTSRQRLQRSSGVKRRAMSRNQLGRGAGLMRLRFS